MNYSYSGVGFVYVLTTRAARTVRRDFNIFGFDNYTVVVIHFGSNLNRSKRSMSSSRSVERRNSHKAMHAVFAFEISVSVRAFDKYRCAFESCLVAVKPIEELYGISVTFRPTGVHSVKHRSPILRFRAACSRMERKDSVISVVRSGKERFNIH